MVTLVIKRRQDLIWLKFSGVQQCVREGQAIGMISGNSNDNLTHMNEGCRIHGHLEVNKVAGNFHIAPGQSFQQQHLHVHSLRNIRLNMLNTTHYINDLSFGEYFPNQINPLSHTKQITNDGAALFHYYVKIVPSTYVFLNKTELRTNQYSVTKHQKIIQNILDSNSHQLPGTFFTYEISAIMVKFVERQRSLAQFVTSSCAIIGGVFTVSSIIDGFLYRGSCLLLMPSSPSGTSVGKGDSGKTAGPRSTSGGAGVRQRKSTAPARSRPGTGGGASAGVWRFYTEDSPGLKVGPVPVLVMSLIFIASVFMLHIWGKYTK
ncbi:unnamed protein product [Rotaria sp. Silwood1]|nr:unnamed protein product [Rotaria sp. Silwood1]